jgi:hypothetical protein
MNVREVDDDVEYVITDEEEHILCPICGESFNDGECEHLRFSCFDGEFTFYGDWDYESYEAKINEKMEADDLGSEVHDILRVLEEIESDDIDEIIYFELNADPTYNPIGIWGYKGKKKN